MSHPASARCSSKTTLALLLAAGLCPLACQAQGVWYGAGGARAQVAAAGAGPVEREIAFGSDVSVRTRMLTRSPGTGSGPTAAIVGRSKVDRIEFLADYKLHGSVRLSGGLSIAGAALGAAGEMQDNGRSVAALSALRAGPATDALIPYLGVGFRQTEPGDRGWDVYGDLGLSLDKRDESGSRAITRIASTDTSREPVAVNSSSLMPARPQRDEGLRVGPRVSLGASYRY